MTMCEFVIDVPIRSFMFMFSEMAYLASLSKEIKYYEELKYVTRRRRLEKFVNKLPWPMSNKDLFVFRHRIINKEKKSMYSFGSSVMSGENWFGLTVPEPDKGHGILYIKK